MSAGNGETNCAYYGHTFPRRLFQPWRGSTFRRPCRTCAAPRPASDDSGNRGKHRTPEAGDRSTVATYPASRPACQRFDRWPRQSIRQGKPRRLSANAGTRARIPATVCRLSVYPARIPATVRPSAPVSGQPLAALTWNAGKPERGRPFDRVPEANAATVRQSIRRPCAASDSPPVSHIPRYSRIFSHTRPAKIPASVPAYAGLRAKIRRKIPRHSRLFPPKSRLFRFIAPAPKKRARAAFPLLPVYARAALYGISRRAQIPLITNGDRRAPLFTRACILYHNSCGTNCSATWCFSSRLWFVVCDYVTMGSP